MDEAARHGKYLLLRWGNGEILVVHLRMSGQLLAAGPRSPLSPHTHAVLRFVGERELRFVDPRTFGELFLAGSGAQSLAGTDELKGFASQRVATGSPAPAGPASVRQRAAWPRRPGAREAEPGSARGGGRLPVELSHLGPDALQVGAAQLAAATRGRRAPLKALLVDQRLIAGVGNIYADEICFSAGLRPDRPGGSLRTGEVRRLASCLRSVLEAAIKARGSTLSDARYLDVEGAAGGYQLEHKVYARAGMACQRCGGLVQRVRFGAKSAFLCPDCQH